jgi:DNA-binding CsgD family transcriptional regulator
MVLNRKRPGKAVPKPEIPESAARLSPLEYEVAVWVGRGGRRREIAIRLHLDVEEVDRLISRAIYYSGCRNIAELEAKFEPDWARIDARPESRREKNEPARALARQRYAAMKDRDLIEALNRFGWDK